MKFQVHKTRMLVADMMSCVLSNSDPIYFEMDTFFQHLVLWDVNFTAFEMCNVGRSLVPAV